MHLLTVVSLSLSVVAVAHAAECVQDGWYNNTRDLSQIIPNYCGGETWKAFQEPVPSWISSACSCLAKATPTTTAAPSRTPTPTPTGPLACGLAGLTQKYVETALKHHNIHRANHTAPFLKWNCTLASYAKTWSDQCTWHHNMTIGNPKPRYGQNMGAGTDIGPTITDGFYGEAPDFAPYYGLVYPSEGLINPKKPQIGHFTQLVWNATTQVGCYTSECPNGVKELGSGYKKVTVCNYNPAGNTDNFHLNVFRPTGGLPTINGYYVFPDNKYL